MIIQQKTWHWNCGKFGKYNLHLVDFFMVHVGRYTIHGWYGSCISLRRSVYASQDVGVWTCLGAKNWILTHSSLILGLLGPVNSTFPLKRGRNFFGTDV